MKKIVISMLALLLAVGASACTDEFGNRQADTNQPDATAPGQVQQEESNQEGAVDTIRADQQESDARAREQREEALGGDSQGEDGDLANEVRRTLEEENLPVNQLTINEGQEGIVSISGTVQTQEELDRIESLAREVDGVESVETNVVVSPS